MKHSHWYWLWHWHWHWQLLGHGQLTKNKIMKSLNIWKILENLMFSADALFKGKNKYSSVKLTFKNLTKKRCSVGQGIKGRQQTFRQTTEIVPSSTYNHRKSVTEQEVRLNFCHQKKDPITSFSQKESDYKLSRRSPITSCPINHTCRL